MNADLAADGTPFQRHNTHFRAHLDFSIPKGLRTKAQGCLALRSAFLTAVALLAKGVDEGG